MDLVEAAQARSVTVTEADSLGAWVEDSAADNETLGWEETLPAPPFKALGDWHDDSFYLDIFKQDQQHKQALAEAARQRKLQAQAQAKAQAQPKAQTAHTAQIATSGKPDAKPKPAKLTKAEAAIGGQSFTGLHFPTLTVSAMPPVHYELVNDTFRLEQVIDKLMLEPMISVDTETSGLDPYASKLLLVQISTPEMSYIIDPNKVNNGPLRRLLENERILKLFHNAKFDYKMLKHHTGVAVNNIYDSYLSERLITAGLGAEANLKAVVKKYLNEEMDKAVRGSFVGLNNIDRISKEQLEYAARDTLALFPVYTKQMERMRGERLLRVADLEFQCVTAVGDLELAGCKIDTEKWRGILKDVAAKRDTARDELMNMLPGGNTRQASMFGGDEYMINLNSGHQIMSEFRKLGVELEDTSEATLSRHNHPAIKLLLEYRGHEKTLGSFGEGLLAMIKPQTGRIHPDFLQYGADTGRFSCANPNVQQIPASSDFRSCFIAEEGYKLITCDYSQAELRILADLSQDAAFLEAFRSGGDLHKLAASQMFQVAVEDVSKEQRNQAKAINFGLAYGMGPQGLAVRIDKTVDEARALIDAYFKAFNGVQRWLQKAGRDSIRTLNSPTPLGRKRYYHALDPEDPDYRKKVSDIDRRGKNAPIQGCVVGSTRIFEQTAGYATIESLCGRAVSVWDGQQFSNATVVYSGQKQLVKIELWGGYYIECSPDHRFLTRGTQGKDVWKTPAEFKSQDRIVLTEGLDKWHCQIDIPTHTCAGSWNAKTDASLSAINDSNDLGQWLGRLASDGSVQAGSLSLLVAEHEEVIMPELQRVSAQLGHVGYQVRVTPTQPQKVHKLTISSRGLVQQVQQLGIKERVPDCAWQDSRLLAGYLRGMFDGDGTVHPDGAILCFGQGRKHLEWARQVQQALLLFGVRSRLNVYDYRINLRVFKTDMPLFCQKIGFINPEKQAKAEAIKSARATSTIYGRAAMVRSVEITDEYVDMYDVVNSDTERFMANGLVVHNCNADMTKMALIYIREKLKGYDARTVNTVHDEIVVEVREDQAEVVCKIVEHEMIRAGEDILKSVPIVADAKIGDYWAK